MGGLHDGPILHPPLHSTGKAASSARVARSEAERAEIEVQANPSTTPSLHRTVRAAPGSFDRRGEGARTAERPTPAGPIRTTPAITNRGAKGSPVRPNVFLFWTGRGPFSLFAKRENGGRIPREPPGPREGEISLTPPARGYPLPPGCRTAAPPPPGPGSGPEST